MRSLSTEDAGCRFVGQALFVGHRRCRGTKAEAGLGGVSCPGRVEASGAPRVVQHDRPCHERARGPGECHVGRQGVRMTHVMSCMGKEVASEFLATALPHNIQILKPFKFWMPKLDGEGIELLN